jgi:hypothetical protein
MGGVRLQYSSKGMTLFPFYRKFSMSFILLFLILISYIAQTPYFLLLSNTRNPLKFFFKQRIEPFTQ